ncbi:uncharacterized protein L201_004060 [Kwoniella dendrophila CBS 6074]|uniref:Uncharacterized protein n=1 Tax=Kwoniella dendrophila CBS 6074 TaxID=1295534 RepID=A0AAX4JWZ9_9TREE
MRHFHRQFAVLFALALGALGVSTSAPPVIDGAATFKTLSTTHNSDSTMTTRDFILTTTGHTPSTTSMKAKTHVSSEDEIDTYTAPSTDNEKPGTTATELTIPEATEDPPESALNAVQMITSIPPSTSTYNVASELTSKAISTNLATSSTETSTRTESDTTSAAESTPTAENTPEPPKSVQAIQTTSDIIFTDIIDTYTSSSVNAVETSSSDTPSPPLTDVPSPTDPPPSPNPSTSTISHLITMTTTIYDQPLASDKQGYTSAFTVIDGNTLYQVYGGTSKTCKARRSAIPRQTGSADSSGEQLEGQWLKAVPVKHKG